jgi:hypothetical protein
MNQSNQNYCIANIFSTKKTNPAATAKTRISPYVKIIVDTRGTQGNHFRNIIKRDNPIHKITPVNPVERHKSKEIGVVLE